MDTTIGGRLSVYQVLKPSPGTEPYVAVTIQFAAQRVIAGLQMGCLPLEVETGRYTPNPIWEENMQAVLNVCGGPKTLSFLAHAVLQQDWNLLFKAVQDHNCTSSFMAMDPDQKTLHLLAPKVILLFTATLY